MDCWAMILKLIAQQVDLFKAKQQQKAKKNTFSSEIILSFLGAG